MKSFLVFCAVLGLAAAATSIQESTDDPILSLESNVEYNGKYHYHYETGAGVKASQDGYLKDVDKDHDGEAVQGQFSYVSKDDGKEYSISYTADENGYQPHGPHIPTPPPIPEAIQRALDYIAAHPYVPKDEKRPAKN